MSVGIREIREEDAQACGRICYEAFAAIAGAHNFPPDLPNIEIATGLIGRMIGSEGTFGVVAEEGGRVLGSNFLHEADAIAGIGPITVDQTAQNRGVGAALMRAVLDRAADKNRLAVRLVQAGYHTRSLSLYAKLGFEVREHLSCFQGQPIAQSLAGTTVRPANHIDLAACNALCRRVHGADRSHELRQAIGQGAASLVERRGRLTGYPTQIAFFGRSVGVTADA